MKKIFLLSFILFPTISLAYTPLTDINLVTRIGQPLVIGDSSLSVLFNQAFYVMLAVAIALAIFMIIRGGYSYIMSADNGGAKTEAKNKIQAAFGGLLLALGAVVILQFINPEILKVEFVFEELNKPEAQKYVNPAKEIDERLLNQQKINSRKKLAFMMKDGFQAGESVTLIQDRLLIIEFNKLTDKEILDNLDAQLSSDWGPDQYKSFLDMIYDQKLFYENDTKSNHFQELLNINDLLNRYESINNSLTYGKHIFTNAKNEYLNKKTNTQ